MVFMATGGKGFKFGFAIRATAGNSGKLCQQRVPAAADDPGLLWQS